MEAKVAPLLRLSVASLDKASAHLDAATKEETTAKGNYDFKKQSLTDEMKYANKDMHAATPESHSCWKL